MPDPVDAFEVLVGLVLRDTQVRVLMGAAPAPFPPALDSRAQRAVDDFLRLYGTGTPTGPSTRSR